MRREVFLAVTLIIWSFLLVPKVNSVLYCQAASCGGSYLAYTPPSNPCTTCYACGSICSTTAGCYGSTPSCSYNSVAGTGNSCGPPCTGWVYSICSSYLCYPSCTDCGSGSSCISSCTARTYGCSGGCTSSDSSCSVGNYCSGGSCSSGYCGTCSDCNGAGTCASKTCTTGYGCASGSYCNNVGSCTAQLAKGSSCCGNAACTSGNCGNGGAAVCCDAGYRCCSQTSDCLSDYVCSGNDCILAPYPQWYSNSTSIVSTYSPSTSSFNITWSGTTISMAFFESNYSASPTNYSMTQLATDVYNYNLTLPAGTFYWKSYANSTSNNWNASSTWYFTINKGTLNGTITGASVTYPTSVNIVPSQSNNNFGTDVNYTFWRNTSVNGGILISSAVNSNPSADTTLLGAGTYSWILNSSGGANWTSNSSITIVTFTVSKETQVATVNLLPGSTVIYPTQTNASCSRTGDPSTTITLYRNNSQVASGISSPQSDIATLTVGIYNYTCIISGNANASAAISANNYLNVSGAYAYNIRGFAFDSSTGTSIQSGSATAIIKETGERFTGPITNGEYNIILSTNLNINQTKFTVGIILSGGGKKGYGQLIVGNGPFSTQIQKCSTNQLHFAGTATDAATGAAITSGTITVNVKEINTYTNSTTFSNGSWDIYISPCLISGGLYTFNFIITSSDGGQSNLFINQIAP